MTIKRKLTLISDPSHGWLSVSTKDVVALGITDKISSYSCMTMSRVFLEEDCDAGLFIEAAKKAGWDITLKHSSSNKRSGIRSKASYRAENVNTPLVAGGKCKILFNDAIMDVVGITSRSVLVGDGDRVHHTISTSNPFIYIEPV